MTTAIERWTYRIVLGISVFLVFVLGWAVVFFWEMDTYHEHLMSRVESIEQGRAKATAKRFTSDDAQDLLLCLRSSKDEQRPCLDRFQARFKPQE